MQSVLVRLARIDEAELINEIKINAYVPTYQGLIGTVPSPAREDYRTRIESGHVWIAEWSGTAAAVMAVDEKIGYLMIYSVAVDPRWQGKGLAKALFAQAEQYAIRNSLPELRLHTNSKMLKNIALYEKLGFTKTGKRPHPSREGHYLIDMAKPILNETMHQTGAG
ncbi:GNAT family N-acetyltransferase [Roseibium sp. SCP14]|uniref:GNAT family N-acetyltransferase n=1 Tax=Roseibium sp. SCP14 TaxID=3141375 RepID=UPI0033372844